MVNRSSQDDKMEKSRLFCIVAISVGVFALLFQAIGFFAPAWISYVMNINTDGTQMKIEVDMGLWATTGCVTSSELGGEEKCRAFSNDEIRHALSGSTSGQSETAKVAGLNFLDDFTKVKVLATLGGLLSVVGMICLFLFSRESGTKMVGIIAAASWGIGAIFVFAAVGLQAQQNSNFNHGIDILHTVPEVAKMLKMKTNFPWAILMSGIGATFNLAVATMITAKACFMHDPNAPGVWNRFSNQAV